jgi:hypothetical protein
MYQQIEAHRKDISFSKWIREAARIRLEQDLGISENYGTELSELSKEILALGRNLNQLVKAANSGLPVNVDRDLLMSLGKMLKETQSNISEVRGKLL